VDRKKKSNLTMKVKAKKNQRDQRKKEEEIEEANSR